MAVVRKTTLVPGKLELLTAWLPRQDWYAGDPAGPSLAKAGGFRLDDPAGERRGGTHGAPRKAARVPPRPA